MCIKEMVYSHTQGSIDILASGNYKGHRYVIISFGSHPCCYVSIPNRKAIDVDSIVCHGGVTYTSGQLPNGEKTDGVWWIGWDYAHFGDYICCSDRKPIEFEKCWSVVELEQECLKVIDEINELTEGANK